MFRFLQKFFRKDNSAIEAALLNGAVILDVRTTLEFQEGHFRFFLIAWEVSGTFLLTYWIIKCKINYYILYHFN